MSCHVTPCHVLSRHVTSFNVISRHFTSCHAMIRHVMSRHVTSSHVMSRPVTSWHVLARHVTSYHTTSCHVMSRHVTSCHVLSRPVTSCHVGCPEGCRFHTASAVYNLVYHETHLLEFPCNNFFYSRIYRLLLSNWFPPIFEIAETCYYAAELRLFWLYLWHHPFGLCSCVSVLTGILHAASQFMTRPGAKI